MKLSSRTTSLRFSLTWMLLTGLAWTVTVTVSPKRAAVVVSTQIQQFSSSIANVTWSVDGVVGGNASVGTITASGLYTPPARAGVHVVKATTVDTPHVSDTATVAVTDLAGVFTYHNDKARTGLNSREFALTPATVTPATFGKLFSCPVDGAIYAQPLWVRALNIAGGIHNVIFVATQHDSDTLSMLIPRRACLIGMSTFWTRYMVEPPERNLWFGMTSATRASAALATSIRR